MPPARAGSGTSIRRAVHAQQPAVTSGVRLRPSLPTPAAPCPHCRLRHPGRIFLLPERRGRPFSRVRLLSAQASGGSLWDTRLAGPRASLKSLASFGGQHPARGRCLAAPRSRLTGGPLPRRPRWASRVLRRHASSFPPLCPRFPLPLVAWLAPSCRFAGSQRPPHACTQLQATPTGAHAPQLCFRCRDGRCWRGWRIFAHFLGLAHQGVSCLR